MKQIATKPKTKKISNQKQKMIQYAVAKDNLVKTTLPQYYNEELGCIVYVYPTKKIPRAVNTKQQTKNNPVR